MFSREFHFVKQIKGRALNNVASNFLLFYSDGLHLVKKENLF